VKNGKNIREKYKYLRADFSPMRLRKFLTVVFELFLILSLYKLWQNLTGLSIGSYLLLALVLLFFLNYWLAKLELGGEWGRNVLYKVFGRMAFTKDWFGILTMFFVVVGFFISRTLFGSAFITYLVIILGIILSYRLLRAKEAKVQERGLLLVGFLIGLGIGSRYAETWFVILIFVLGHIFFYFTSYPGEKEEGLQ
jgi:hypothetical protein